MRYEDIRYFSQRCEEHPDHQSGMVTNQMISERLEEEIDELRAYIESRQWVGLTDDEQSIIYNDLYTQYTRDDVNIADFILIARTIELQLKEKNGG